METKRRRVDVLKVPKVSLLRLQATSNCNLNCSYCYIPASVRRATTKMSNAVLDVTLSRLVMEDLLERSLLISWHGGEPLRAGVSWYDDAFARIAHELDRHTAVSHTVTTNGVLITDEWCALWRRHSVDVAVSLDGDREQSSARVNWGGRPAFDAAVQGIDILNSHGFRWTLLTVVTWATMRDPESFIRFVRSTGCSYLGFKVEETNVAHVSDLEGRRSVEATYADFVTAVWNAFPPGSSPVVREFDEFRAARLAGRSRQVVPVTLVPLRNLTVSATGDFTVFSGELLFRDDDRFVFGNVLDGPITDCLTTERFRDVSSEILAGVRRCAKGCPRYKECGSFFISQKYAETGTFDVDETLACRLEMKTMFDALDAVTAPLPRRTG